MNCEEVSYILDILKMDLPNIQVNNNKLEND